MQYRHSFPQKSFQEDWTPQRRNSLPNLNNHNSYPMIQNNQFTLNFNGSHFNTPPPQFLRAPIGPRISSPQPVRSVRNNQALQSESFENIEIKKEPEEYPVNT